MENGMQHGLDTGKMIKDFMAERKVSQSQLGGMIDRQGISVLNYTRGKTIQTGILLKISHALKHNFFQDIANELPSDYTVNKDIFAERDAVIAQLMEENKVLKIQNELLMKLKS